MQAYFHKLLDHILSKARYKLPPLLLEKADNLDDMDVDDDEVTECMASSSTKVDTDMVVE